MSLLPLNYLRSASEELRRVWIPAMKRKHPRDAEVCEEILEEAAAAPKFVLPRGGRIFNDRLRGLPDSLKLPYPVITIEYEASDAKDGLVEAAFGTENSASAPKRIVLAQEVDDWIDVFSLVQLSTNDGTFWIMQPYAASIRKVENSQATRELPANINVGQEIDGLEVINVATGTIAPKEIGPGWRRNAYCDLMDECNAVLELIEALSCINVTHEALPARKPNKSAIKRGALPFDEYRVLVIREHERGTVRSEPLGSHRSPREHLRRGHIRRLQDGRKVWVNPTVVNAGTTGKVTTTYDTRQASSMKGRT